jgi:ubiquinone/menaquinone biosynthesis C-methylase UbiE
MNNQQAYNNWAAQYDTNQNKTRDLEAFSLRETLSKIDFNKCLEIGCGTGKNTEWLQTKAHQIIAVDFSNEMLNKAKEKVRNKSVNFIKADLNEDWNFAANDFDIIVFSLVLEHIENLESVFYKASKILKPSGFIYIGELHPFKQYTGSKARFEIGKELTILTCFNHHISDYITAAKKYGFKAIDIEEYFDDNNKSSIPRILTILFQLDFKTS